MSFWDERYAEPGYAYGTEPNQFLASQARHIKAGGRVLCLAEGQGRNAVFLAEQGFKVHAVDLSSVGLAKARALAEEHGVTITTEVADLAKLEIEPGAWDGVISISAHLPSAIRASLHRRVVAGLAPGGVLILEAYTPRQVEINGLGGPKDVDLLMTLAALRVELAGLDLQIAQEIDREVNEGAFHKGRAAVVQVRGTLGQG